MIPPLWVTLKIKHFTLWLPLFLLWVLLLVLLSPVLVLLLLAALVLVWFPEGRQWLRLLGQVWLIFCSLRGLRVDVNKVHERVSIHFI